MEHDPRDYGPDGPPPEEPPMRDFEEGYVKGVIKEIEMKLDKDGGDQQKIAHERRGCGCELQVGTMPCNVHAYAQELLEAAKDYFSQQGGLGSAIRLERITQLIRKSSEK
jgi:hypothetical protein